MIEINDQTTLGQLADALEELQVTDLRVTPNFIGRRHVTYTVTVKRGELRQERQAAPLATAIRVVLMQSY